MQMKSCVFLLVSLVFALGPCVANALMWNDPGINPVQRISDKRWIDGNTGRLINTAGMPVVDGLLTPPILGASGGASSTSSSAASAAAGAADDAAAAVAGAAEDAAGEVAKKTGKAAGWKDLGKAGKALSVVGVVGGTAGVVASTVGKDEHSWGNVVGGVASGAAAGAGLASIVPGLGTVIGAVGGAVIGGVVSGSQLFSETDCLHDPITGKFTCCNTVFNKGERQVGIGGYMFCGVEQNGQMVPLAPGVRQCLQGGSETEASWFDGLWKDDYWSPGECKTRYCKNVTPPNNEMSEYVKWLPDTTNFCFNWDCVDGYKKHDGGCIPQNTTPGAPDAINVIPLGDYETVIQKIDNEILRITNTCAEEMGTFVL